MKTKLLGILAVLLLLAGFLVLNYPVLSTLRNQLNQGQVLSAYDQAVEALSEEEREALLADARAYNKRLSGGDQQLADAFSEEADRKDRDYEAILDVCDGAMASLEIPKISLYLPIYHGTSLKVLEKGVGHLEGSSLPVGGKSTHAVLTGHRGLPSAELFTNLDQMEAGDVFYMHVLGDTFAYEVYDTETVLPTEMEPLSIRKGEDLVTLVTCTPYGINTHRLFVHARRTAYDGAKEEDTFAKNLGQWLLAQKTLLISTGILLLLLLGSVMRGIARRKKRKKEEKSGDPKKGRRKRRRNDA